MTLRFILGFAIGLLVGASIALAVSHSGGVSHESREP